MTIWHSMCKLGNRRNNLFKWYFIFYLTQTFSMLEVINKKTPLILWVSLIVIFFCTLSNLTLIIITCTFEISKYTCKVIAKLNVSSWILNFRTLRTLKIHPEFSIFVLLKNCQSHNYKTVLVFLQIKSAKTNHPVFQQKSCPRFLTCWLLIWSLSDLIMWEKYN
jgi:hypothetical protein